MVLLKIHEKYISGEIMLPLSELQTAIGKGVNDNSEKLVERLGDTLKSYILKHIRPATFDGKRWQVVLGEMKVIETKSKLTGDYKELVVKFTMTPPHFYDLRNFYFDYDVIVHQVITHKILVSVKQDWQQGIISEDSTLQQIGVIELDVPSGTIKPFQISLQQGSKWKGFKNMVSLGITHIAEGTDHLLFLLTLLLPAMLLAENKQWGKYAGLKLSAFNLLKIVTAFTIGHSITLLLGTLHWLQLPVKPIEILIAVTILVSAIHAFLPIYPKKEVWVAGGFGLIHGMAFAETLTNLELSAGQMALSILGFNIGIELLQLLIILVVFPILVLLSKSHYYTFIRRAGSVAMIVIALLWMIERIEEKPNIIAQWFSHL